MADKPTCEEVIFVSGALFGDSHHRPCGKPGKVQVDGKWYCGIHNPERKAKREAEGRAKYEVRMAKWNKERLAIEMHDDLVAALEAALICPACGGKGEVDINDFGAITSPGTMDICPLCEGEDYEPDFPKGTFELVKSTLARARGEK